MSFAPVDWTALENALHDWTARATGIPGDRVTFVEPALAGATLPVLPAAQISPLSGPGELFAAQVDRVPGITRYRLRVLANGPGDAGVLFYPGRSLTSISIPLTAALDDPPAVTAAALAAAIGGAVPAGYTATVDPENAAVVLVDGSEPERMFALAAVDPAFVGVELARA